MNNSGQPLHPPKALHWSSPELELARHGTLTYRVAYLLEQGIPPECILLLTFTNKAAREMMQRVGDLLGAQTLSYVGRHLSFHRCPYAEETLRSYRISTRFHHHGSRRCDAIAPKLHPIGRDRHQSDPISQSQGSGRYPLLGHQPAMQRRTHLENQFPYFSHLAEEMARVRASVPGGVRQKTT